MTPRDVLLEKVVAYAAENGIAGKSLREIAAGVGSSHRMVLHHFGSREGLMTAIVQVIEARQRDLMTSLADQAATPRELMVRLWEQVSSPQLRPFVRLFFEVFAMAAQGVPGTEGMLASLTEPWLRDGVAVAEKLGQPADVAALRLGVAASRGLLLDLLAGADPAEVDAAYQAFIDRFEP
jgi:AcrR family transcriptional regulator